MKRLRHTSERLCSHILARKIALNQSRCGVTDHQCIGRSQSLNSRRDIGCFSEGKLLLSPSTAHVTDHNQPSMDAQTESELNTFGWLQPLMRVSHRIKDSQPRAYCSVRIIFMGLRIPKVHEESIP